MTADHLNVLGVEMDVRACRLLCAPLRLFGPHADLHRPARHPVVLEVRSGRHAPGRDAFSVRTHSAQVQVTPDGPDSAWVHGVTQDVHLRVGRERSVITVQADTSDPDEALMVAFTEVLRAQGLLPLHAAAFEHHGRVTALLGPSGTGKSTALLGALLAGARPVTEDYGLYEPATGLLHGLDGGLRCLPDTLARVRAAVPDLPEPATVRGKALVTWAMLGAEQRWHAPLTHVEVLRRDGQGAGVRPLPLAQRVMSLWAATGVPLLPLNRDWTNGVISTLAREWTWEERTLPDRRAP
ncbi:hypothetical protein [Deinococcus xianganensis]|uniref:Serine kinase n=1 Tax=Deinococcus xianganensis TaxID=1507289 RepID=A0A6I4YMC5_9DEIO|nr:hypothetical protein [Deinococcus xianganensis]MXV21131.1 hypothetical protein [Deinococcus xianganensis]